MNRTKIGLGIASALAAGTLAGGAAVAQASDSTGATGATSTGSSAQQGDTTSPEAANGGTDASCAGGGPGTHEHTAVTGDELTSVTDAVTAHDSAVTVDSVRKDPDGSYDVLATKDGQKVMFEVSADLATITENTGGPRQGGGRQDGQPGQRMGQPPAQNGTPDTATPSSTGAYGT